MTQDDKPHSTPDDATPAREGFLSRLAAGDFGLARTFWLYSVVVAVLFNLATWGMQVQRWYVLLVVLFLFWEATSLMGTWNAATRYKGRFEWTAMAKVAVILGVISMAAMLYGVSDALVNP